MYDKAIEMIFTTRNKKAILGCVTTSVYSGGEGGGRDWEKIHLNYFFHLASVFKKTYLKLYTLQYLGICVYISKTYDLVNFQGPLTLP